MGYFDEAKSKRELAHHGILGQKWGVRRFQDYNGKRIGAAKTTKKKHVFEDHSKSKSTRGEMVKAVVGSYALTAVSAIGNVSLASAGLINPGLLLMTPVSAALSVGSTVALVSGDIFAIKANKKEKQFKEEREKAPIDKKTGFHKKTKEMTASEDMERVNPGYDNWDENTKNNCVLCSMSYELRRRGYDVQAKKATEGYNQDSLVGDWFNGAKPKKSKGSLTDEEAINNAIMGTPMDGSRKNEIINDTLSTIEKQPKGSRGALSLTWDGTTYGHSVAYANENGKAVIYDTQSNTKYESTEEVRDYLYRCSQVSVIRLDNCSVNTKYIKEVAE